MIPANLTSFAVESGIAMAKEEHIVCFLFNPNLNHVWLTRRVTSSHTHCPANRPGQNLTIQRPDFCIAPKDGYTAHAEIYTVL